MACSQWAIFPRTRGASEVEIGQVISRVRGSRLVALQGRVSRGQKSLRMTIAKSVIRHVVQEDGNRQGET